MNRLFISTRGSGSWRGRLANPGRQWKRKFSALETAVSWELAGDSDSGIPDAVEKVLLHGGYCAPRLLFGVVEHKVDLPGGRAASQCDVWAVVGTGAGMLSLTVEAKAREAFGDKALVEWLRGNGTERSKTNRAERWNYIQAHLPKSDAFMRVRYQLLHRCAAAVVEAKRLGFPHAAFVVQAFGAPASSFEDYANFCRAVNLPADRGTMATTAADGVSLGVGWADCPLANHEQVAATV